MATLVAIRKGRFIRSVDENVEKCDDGSQAVCDHHGGPVRKAIRNLSGQRIEKEWREHAGRRRQTHNKTGTGELQHEVQYSDAVDGITKTGSAGGKPKTEKAFVSQKRYHTAAKCSVSIRFTRRPIVFSRSTTECNWTW